MPANNAAATVYRPSRFRAPCQDYLGDSSAQPPPAGPRLLLEPEFEVRAAPYKASGLQIEIAIGPEGGFTAGELEAFRISRIFGTLRLGPRMLRTETAAIAAITWLQSRFGDLRAQETV